MAKKILALTFCALTLPAMASASTWTDVTDLVDISSDYVFAASDIDSTYALANGFYSLSFTLEGYAESFLITFDYSARSGWHCDARYTYVTCTNGSNLLFEREDYSPVAAGDDIEGGQSVDPTAYTQTEKYPGAEPIVTGDPDLIGTGQTYSGDYTVGTVYSWDAASNITSGEQTIYFTGQNVTGLDITYTIYAENYVAPVAPVPLPAGAPLLLAGLGGMALMRRRRGRAG